MSKAATYNSIMINITTQPSDGIAKTIPLTINHNSRKKVNTLTTLTTRSKRTSLKKFIICILEALTLSPEIKAPRGNKNASVTEIKTKQKSTLFDGSLMYPLKVWHLTRTANSKSHITAKMMLKMSLAMPRSLSVSTPIKITLLKIAMPMSPLNHGLSSIFALVGVFTIIDEARVRLCIKVRRCGPSCPGAMIRGRVKSVIISGMLLSGDSLRLNSSSASSSRGRLPSSVTFRFEFENFPESTASIAPHPSCTHERA
mmetsp:Transcript_132589/g.424269  ORF Transcript_132589/g.424269 Transcript_132589/m.424269 type:complete len:257 (-) Transcript_132589:24-794(-)